MRWYPLVFGVVLSSWAGFVRAEASPVVSPAARSERQQLEATLALTDPKAQTAAFAELLVNGKDPEVHRHTYRAFVQAYRRLLAAGGASSPTLEERIVDTQLPANEMLSACYGLIGSKSAEAVIGRCLAAVPANAADPEVNAERNRLEGTLALAHGDAPAAARALSAAALVIGVDRDPKMHLGLTQAQRQVGNAPAACATARELYRLQPLLSGARDALAACGKVEATANAVTAEAKKALLATQRPAGEPLPVLSLESDPLHPVDLDPAKLGKVTVLVFFSTWCSHCAAEMPRIMGFAKALSGDARLAKKAQIIGIRTAVEREQEPYEAFARRHKLSFRVLTDSTMSMVFAQFARVTGLPTNLPTVAVLDAKGVLRFVLESGDYKDTANELGWAVSALAR